MVLALPILPIFANFAKRVLTHFEQQKAASRTISFFSIKTLTPLTKEPEVF